MFRSGVAVATEWHVSLLTMGVMVAVAVGRMSLFTLDRGPQIGKTVLVLCRFCSWVLSWS